MNLKKFKVGTILYIRFIDIHSNSTGWTTKEGSLADTPCYVDAYGEYLGNNKYNEAVLGTMCNHDEGFDSKYGVRIYIPLGCIVSVKKFK